MTDLNKINYNPDVLSCLASLSNDEVFTPPDIVNQMLDRLPERLWSDPNAKFLDPVSKSGVFLREIAKRLIKGLEPQIPDLQTRLDHIFSQQLYGIAITELTALLSRRSLYCAKKANSEYAICRVFETEEGNIFKPKAEHKWENGKCSECGAAQAVYDRFDHQENHAYAFIHQKARTELGLEKMKFDVIIGNPPYQLKDEEDEKRASASPIYHYFVRQAKKLNPDYLVMIIPSRWFAGGKGLDDFRDEMLKDRHMKEIHDFTNAADCFPGVEIKGGVNYFLWKKSHQGDCLITTYENGKQIDEPMIRPLQEKGCDVFIRYNKAVSILRKVMDKNEVSFNSIISSAKPFGLRTFVKGNTQPYAQGKSIKLYQNGGTGYFLRENILVNRSWIDKEKVIMPYAVGSGDSKTDYVKAIYAGAGSACTETYLVVGPFDDKKTCENVMSYINTRFFHFMLTLKKNTQHATKRAYEFVPIQDFSKSWSDKELYTKYGLSKEEIAYIEEMVLPNKELDNE